MFNGLYIFRGQQYENLRCFVAFCKMSRFTRKKCSATAQNRGGGGVQPIWAMPIFRLFFFVFLFFYKNGFPNGLELAQGGSNINGATPSMSYRCTKIRMVRITPPAAPWPPLPLPFPDSWVVHSFAPESFPFIHLVPDHFLHCFPLLLWLLHLTGLSIGFIRIIGVTLGFILDCFGLASVGSTALLILP